MVLLSSTNSIKEILFTGYFLFTVILSITTTFGINIGLVYAFNKEASEKWVVFDGNVCISIIIMLLIMPLISFFGTGGIRARVIAGKNRPLAQTSLCDTMIMRTLFFSMAVPNWKSRLLRFVGNAFLIPGIPVTVVLAFACWADLGFCSITSSEKCTLSLWGFLVLDASWKTAVAVVLHTMNFVAAHNDAQPELYEDNIEDVSTLKEQVHLPA